MPVAVRRAMLEDIERQNLSHNERQSKIDPSTGRLVIDHKNKNLEVIEVPEPEKNVEFDVVTGLEPEEGVEFEVVTNPFIEDEDFEIPVLDKSAPPESTSEEDAEDAVHVQKTLIEGIGLEKDEPKEEPKKFQEELLTPVDEKTHDEEPIPTKKKSSTKKKVVKKTPAKKRVAKKTTKRTKSTKAQSQKKSDD